MEMGLRPLWLLHLALLLASVSSPLEAQQRTADLPPRSARLALVARVSPDSIVLRWAPTTAGGWLTANRIGYVLRRVTLGHDGKPIPNSAMAMTSTPLHPWPLDVWKQRAARDDRFAAIAAQALHGKGFASKGEGIDSGTDIRNGKDELTNRFAFALVAADNDAVAAEGLALRFVDHDVHQGVSYVYRLTLAASDSSYRVDTAYTMVSPSAFQKAPPVNHLTAETGEHSVRLSWNNLPAGRSYSGFFVSRSDDGGRRYVRLNSMPYTTVRGGRTPKTDEQSYYDTTAINYRTYRYRVEGVTPFGELSEGADVDGHAGDRTPPPAPVIVKPEQLTATSFRITWQMPANPSDLAGFAIYRSGFALKGYKLLYPKATDLSRAMSTLLPPSTRSYEDNEATMIEPYYIVGAVDTSGNMSQSLPAYGEIIDTIPPAMPVGLAGAIDTNGIVRLHWRLGSEKNLIGYRVVWTNSPNHEFTMRTNETIADTGFVDSIQVSSLTREIYYKIIAVNARKMFSKPSAALTLRRPDVVPPQSPLFTDVTVSDSIVHLLWNTSKSTDTKEHHLFRRLVGEEQWEMLAVLGRDVGSFSDRSVHPRSIYEYRIEAKDSSGLVSGPSPTVIARPYDTGVRPGVQSLRVKRDATNGQLRLSWEYSGRVGEKIWFVVYRAIGVAPLMETASVDQSKRTYADPTARDAGFYRYAIKVRGYGGIESQLSTPVSIQR